MKNFYFIKSLFYKGRFRGIFDDIGPPPTPASGDNTLSSFRKGDKKMMFTFTVIPDLISLSLPFIKGDLEGFLMI